MKLLAVILFFSLIGYLDACQCQINQTVKYDISSTQISEPSNSGTFGDTSCAPIDCTSTITITPPDGGQMYGGNITIVGCDGLNGDNYLVVYSGDQVVRNFTSCPNTPYYLAADTSNIINFSFHIKNNISFTGFVFPIPAIAPPTTTPTVATTTPYPGPYSSNPATQRVDLIVALDFNKANTFFNQSKQFLQDITPLFSYNSQDPNILYPNTTHPYARLSLMRFDGIGSPPFAAYPWSLDQTSLIQNLGTGGGQFPGKAKVFTALRSAFGYMNLYGFKFRENTQRVLVYFAGTDCNEEDDVTNITQLINQFNLKVIVVNMDTSKTFTQANFPCLKQLTGTASNVATSYNYKGTGPDLKSFITTVYQDGNSICNRENPQTKDPSQGTAIYQIPLPNDNSANPAVYCNYMTNVQKYAGDGDASHYIQVLFTNVSTVYGSDTITIDINGTAVALLSGQYAYSPYYCLPAGNGIVGVTFKSSGGTVLSGYTTYVNTYASKESCTAAPASTTTPTGFAKTVEYRLMPLNKFF
uniref:VWFA domain-containing protein n=1 Tax=Panagrolaimus sp. JU765 TaxID=591449 RepID=A0AC34RGZ3_9BILA